METLPPCASHDILPGAGGVWSAYNTALAHDSLLRHVRFAWASLRRVARSRILHVLLKKLLEANPCQLYAIVYSGVQMGNASAESQAGVWVVGVMTEQGCCHS